MLNRIKDYLTYQLNKKNIVFYRHYLYTSIYMVCFIKNGEFVYQDLYNGANVPKSYLCLPQPPLTDYYINLKNINAAMNLANITKLSVKERLIFYPIKEWYSEYKWQKKLNDLLEEA